MLNFEFPELASKIDVKFKRTVKLEKNKKSQNGKVWVFIPD